MHLELPHPHAALEPVFDTLTMQIHHGKHRTAYLSNHDTALANFTIEEILAGGASRSPNVIRPRVIHNGGGHLSSALLGQVLAPRGGRGAPSEGLARAIESAFRGLEALKSSVDEAGVKRFGTGRAWYVHTADGCLEATSSAGQDSPLRSGSMPVLGIHVWEHADDQHRHSWRVEYLRAIWEVVNGTEVCRRFGE